MTYIIERLDEDGNKIDNYYIHYSKVTDLFMFAKDIKFAKEYKSLEQVKNAVELINNGTKLRAKIKYDVCHYIVHPKENNVNKAYDRAMKGI